MVKNKKFKQRVGSRAQVMHGTAKMTSGGLMKKHLKYNKRGKIVSKKASKTAKKLNKLVKAGYKTKKGKFGVVMKGGIGSSNVNTELKPIQKKSFVPQNRRGPIPPPP